ncbi:hypothetical protein AVHM3334_19840 [Acidovorax sp. SUPP3334]|nr:hypothetical protein AVHM3334_19840 [Acidovorax sp. SUPP3334]
MNNFEASVAEANDALRGLTGMGSAAEIRGGEKKRDG